MSLDLPKSDPSLLSLMVKKGSQHEISDFVHQKLRVLLT